MRAFRNALLASDFGQTHPKARMQNPLNLGVQRYSALSREMRAQRIEVPLRSDSTRDCNDNTDDLKSAPIRVHPRLKLYRTIP
jgi:hypothetical protein